MAASQDTKSLIENAVNRFLAEVPALQSLKLVVALELRARGDTQIYRVEVPGPKVTKEIPAGARVRIAVARSDFNELATEGKVKQWREAVERGHVKVSGPPEILKLIVNVVERHERRGEARKRRL